VTVLKIEFGGFAVVVAVGVLGVALLVGAPRLGATWASVMSTYDRGAEALAEVRR
jgi:hypothetical protein